MTGALSRAGDDEVGADAGGQVGDRVFGAPGPDDQPYWAGIPDRTGACFELRAHLAQASPTQAVELGMVGPAETQQPLAGDGGGVRHDVARPWGERDSGRGRGHRAFGPLARWTSGR
ncbi:hypothetical protein O1R50_19860 [Glycomyces luteolus]|uniref:Uncharacterized protein n=1 Tax=Glycomyces luteolus TaxID=2670330 RepID=A0A9X3PAL4_9ACTN|nr:hypothetical protein [Glycomyces luteolus]MDA1361893.1 hypothetical protein [Glycomyces luteolus]